MIHQPLSHNTKSRKLWKKHVISTSYSKPDVSPWHISVQITVWEDINLPDTTKPRQIQYKENLNALNPHEPGSNKKCIYEMPLMSTQALHWFPQVQLCSNDAMQLAGRTIRTIRKQSDEAQWFCVPAGFQQAANLKLKFPLYYHSHNRGFSIFIFCFPVQVIFVMLFLSRALRAYPWLHCEGCYLSCQIWSKLVNRSTVGR